MLGEINHVKQAESGPRREHQQPQNSSQNPGEGDENAARNTFRTSLVSKEIQEVETQMILPGALLKDVIKDLWINDDVAGIEDTLHLVDVT